MKYRTVIELTCDACDKEEALNAAGEYLRGTMDYGVEMRCRTMSFRTRRVIAYGIVSLTLLFAFGMISLRALSFPINGSSLIEMRMPGTYTVIPELKTKNPGEFRKEWEEEKEAAILNYLKK